MRCASTIRCPSCKSSASSRHHAVRFDDQVSLVQILRFEPRREQPQLFVGDRHCLAEARNLGRHQIGRNAPIDDDQPWNHQADIADRNALRGSCAAQCSTDGHQRRLAAAKRSNNSRPLMLSFAARV